jgi:hypothetical protein
LTSINGLPVLARGSHQQLEYSQKRGAASASPSQ